jgi:hypothetical protein
LHYETYRISFFAIVNSHLIFFVAQINQQNVAASHNLCLYISIHHPPTLSFAAAAAFASSRTQTSVETAISRQKALIGHSAFTSKETRQCVLDILRRMRSTGNRVTLQQ